MATIYPFSIYTSQGKVYPSSGGGGGDDLEVDLSFLGYIPEYVNQELDSINLIYNTKSFDLTQYPQTLYMFPDLNGVDTTDWDKTCLNFYEQTEITYPNTLSFDLDDFDSMYHSCFAMNNGLKNVVFTGSCPLDFGEEEMTTGYCKINRMFVSCHDLQTITGLDLSDYDYINYNDAFNDCNNLTSFINCSFPTALYGDNTNAFKACFLLTALPTITDTSEVTSFEYAFWGLNITSYSNTFDLTNCTNTTCMFSGNHNLTTTPTIINMTEDVTSFDGMFEHIGENVWNEGYDPEQESYYTPTDSVTIKFANDANSTNAFNNAYLISSITVDTENMPTGQFLNPVNCNRNWLSQLTIYVPSTKVQDWIDFLKSDCEGDPDLELMMESMVQAIS